MDIRSDHDVFISYSSKNKDIADAIVNDMESNGIRCWYAPRDVRAGEEWASAINSAISRTGIMVLIYTDESNVSKQVMNEVALAFNAGKTIVPFRLSADKMSNELEYYLSRVHWMDAVDAPVREKISELRDYVKVILAYPDASPFKTDPGSSDKNAVKKKSRKKKLIPALAAVIMIVLAGIITKLMFDSSRLMERGREAFHSKYHDSDSNEAAREYFEKAKEKDKDAYYYLGELDRRECKYEDAIAHFEEGIDKGSDLARIGLGFMYQKGDEINEDNNKARQLFDEAYQNGCIEADAYRASILPSDPSENGYLSGEEVVKMLENVASNSRDPYFVSIALQQVADMYRTGSKGINKDNDKAIEYYTKAVEVYPYSEGEINRSLSYLYRDAGDEQKANQYGSKALEFFETAASKGNVVAMTLAAGALHNGISGSRDDEGALEYYKMAAERGSIFSMRRIGEIYEKGTSTVAVNYDKAYEWYKKAADKNDAASMYSIGELYHSGKLGKVKDVIDHHLAIQWFEKSGECGYGAAWVILAQMCYAKEGFDEADSKQINSYLDKGIDLGSGIAMLWKAIYYMSGDMGEPDYEKVYDLIFRAYEAGSADARYYLGKLYEQGLVPGLDGPDYEEARKWYLNALSNNFSKILKDTWCEAAVRLGNMYYNGNLKEGVDKDAALEWYLKAANEGDLEAMYRAGLCYENPYENDGHDYNNAAYWYKKAAEEGNDKAGLRLEEIEGFVTGQLNDIGD